MDNCVIKKGAVVEYAIVDSGCEIGEDAKVGGPKDEGKLTVIAKDNKIRKNGKVKQGDIVYHEEEDQ